MKLGCKVLLHLGYLPMGKRIIVYFFLHQLHRHFLHLLLLSYCIVESEDSILQYNLEEVFSEVGEDVFRKLEVGSEKLILVAKKLMADGCVELVQGLIVQHPDL